MNISFVMNMKTLVLMKWSYGLAIELRMVVIFSAHSPISFNITCLFQYPFLKGHT